MMKKCFGIFHFFIFTFSCQFLEMQSFHLDSPFKQLWPFPQEGEISNVHLLRCGVLECSLHCFTPSVVSCPSGLNGLRWILVIHVFGPNDFAVNWMKTDKGMSMNKKIMAQLSWGGNVMLPKVLHSTYATYHNWWYIDLWPCPCNRHYIFYLTAPSAQTDPPASLCDQFTNPLCPTYSNRGTFWPEFKIEIDCHPCGAVI